MKRSANQIVVSPERKSSLLTYKNINGLIQPTGIYLIFLSEDYFTKIGTFLRVRKNRIVCLLSYFLLIAEGLKSIAIFQAMKFSFSVFELSWRQTEIYTVRTVASNIPFLFSETPKTLYELI